MRIAVRVQMHDTLEYNAERVEVLFNIYTRDHNTEYHTGTLDERHNRVRLRQFHT